MQSIQIPRSTLHAVAPQGMDSPEVESLTSYFCRLAYSHGMTSQKLADWVLTHFERSVSEKYAWYQRNLSSMSEESEDWAAWLSELTGVACLDQLTLAPWRHLLGMPGLAPKSDRWCPCCFAEDRREGREPYFRLAWEIAPSDACLRHKVQLTSTCPHCQRGNVRNRASVVVPGYCTACGGFLGEGDTAPATPEAMWIARQVGGMLAQRPRLASDGVVPVLEAVIERMAEGSISMFASRYGFSKSGVWHWLRKGGLPTIRGWLTIALTGGIGLKQLFAGEIEGWVVPQEPLQMAIPLAPSPRAGIRSRELDWERIRADLQAILELPIPISINEASERVGVGRKHLYLRMNTLARAIADRHSRYRTVLRQRREAEFQARIGEMLDNRRAAGLDGMSARDVWETLDEESQAISGVFGHINQVISRNRK